MTIEEAQTEIERLKTGLMRIVRSEDHSEAVFLAVVILGGPDMRVFKEKPKL